MFIQKVQLVHDRLLLEGQLSWSYESIETVPGIGYSD